MLNSAHSSLGSSRPAQCRGPRQHTWSSRPWCGQLQSLARPLTTLPPGRAGDAVWSLVPLALGDPSWKHSSYRPASSRSERWATRHSYWPSCWPQRFASPSPSLPASWWPHWSTTPPQARWGGGSPRHWGQTSCAGSSACRSWPWPAGC